MFFIAISPLILATKSKIKRILNLVLFQYLTQYLHVHLGNENTKKIICIYLFWLAQLRAFSTQKWQTIKYVHKTRYSLISLNALLCKFYWEVRHLISRAIHANKSSSNLWTERGRVFFSWSLIIADLGNLQRLKNVVKILAKIWFIFKAFN